MFRMTKLYQEHQSCIKTLHGFSNRVIKERKAEITDQNNNDRNNNDNNNNNNGNSSNNVKNLNMLDETDESKYEFIDFPRKKRLAFLDLLIEASQSGNELSDEDIREEVDTFMFEVSESRCKGSGGFLYVTKNGFIFNVKFFLIFTHVRGMIQHQPQFAGHYFCWAPVQKFKKKSLKSLIQSLTVIALDHQL